MNKKLLNGRFILGLLKDTFNDWMEDGALRLSAALAYYSIFSIAPLLIICLGVVGWASWVVGPDAVDKYIYGELGKLVGAQSADMVRSMVKSATHPNASKLAAVVGGVLLVVGASGVFGQLKDALNTIWEVRSKSGFGMKGFLRQRVLTFGMVLVMGFLLLVSLLLSTVVAGFSHMLESVLPVPWLLAPLGVLLSFGIVTLLFAFIFKVLPDATVEWRHVWVGAAVTGILFEIGKLLLGLYLGRESTSSSYGAAGAVVLLLLWVYYASCILFFGAEFTQTYARALGSEIKPNEYGEAVTSEMRAQQGLSPCKREESPPAPPEIVTVPVYSPPPAVPFPHHVRDVPGYLYDSPAASLMTAVGCGFAVGMIARALEVERPRKPMDEITHGSREIAHGSSTLALASLPVLANLARRVWGGTKKRLDPGALCKTGRRWRNAVIPVALVCTFAANAGEKTATKNEREEMTRLQVFLDRANFGPGKIDGRNGEFTAKALALYRQETGGSASNAAPNGSLDANDLSMSEPVFILYTVTKQDVEATGELPETRTAQAKLALLPYRTALEAIAEKFHTDLDYLKELNPGVGEDLQEGAKLSVPNVPPFELATLKAPRSDAPDAGASGGAIAVHVSTVDGMLTVREGERIRAAFPITSGSQQTASPIGSWTIKGVAKLPEFRWDEKMLEEGERSSNFVMLPPGPNNPVGVVWIALNKKGIGIHGTDEPDAIGRSASHGCIRLANWDIARLAEMVKTGVPVVIE